MSSYGGGKGSRTKDPNQPKKPMTGYFLFLQDFRERHRGKDIPNKELLKMGKKSLIENKWCLNLLETYITYYVPIEEIA